MSKSSRFIGLSSVLLLVLFVNLACPVAVYADDGTPPPPATEEPVQPPAEPPVLQELEDPAGGGAAATQVPVTTEEASPDGIAATEAPVEGAVAEPSATEEATIAEVLDAAPQGTEVVVLDESGEALPLASTEAAAVVVVVDPVWCPAGQNPGNDLNDGMQNCTTNFPSPQALIDDMGADVDGIYDRDGVIYFTAAPGGQFILTPGSGSLDAAEYTAISDNNLILQGGWNGASGAGYALGGQTVFDANPVQIGTETNPWIGNITINNLTIQGASTTGLTVFGAGDITLTNVISNDNAGNGAFLDNCIADEETGECLGAGKVSIRSSTFGDGSTGGNEGHGVEVYSSGDITLSGVSADDNARDGAYLDNSYSDNGNIDVRASTFGSYDDRGTGDPTDDVLYGNDGVGLEVYSLGNIKLDGVSAYGNGAFGAMLNNFFGGNVTITASTFGDYDDRGNDDPADDVLYGNGQVGLMTMVYGNTTLTGVTANGNSGDGAALISVFTGTVLIVDSHFDGNAREEGYGLTVLAMVTVKLNGVSVSGNKNAVGNGGGASIGAYTVIIENSVFDGNGYDGAAVSGETVTIQCSQFTNNGGVGVDGTSTETFTLNSVTFLDNLGGDYIGAPFIRNGACQTVVGGQGNSRSSLPLHIVPVGGGEKVDLDCRGYSGTRLILPSGDNVILYCPVLDDAYLTSLTLPELPAVPGGATFVSGMEVKVTRGGEPRTSVGPNVIISFVVPEDKVGSSFTILHWDGSAWTELGGSYVDGYFSVETNLTGVFVLAIK